MDIFEFALKMEQDGMDLYLRIADGSDDEGIKKVFKSLADDEERHQKAIHMMKESSPDIETSKVLSEAKNVFALMKDSGGGIDISQPQSDLYKAARDLEADSVSFYAEKADEEKSPDRKKIFEALAEEEKKHLFLLDHMVEFVSRPQTWLEDAEFNHLEEY